MKNLLLHTDSYKLTHFDQYPPGTEGVYSYFESRTGAKFPSTTFFGLQYLIKENLLGEVVTREKIDEAEALVVAHLGSADLFNRAGWEYIVDHYDGRLPLRIRAVPEGTAVPVSNVLMTVENTDPNCFWLTNYVESLLTHVWYSSTVATLSRSVKRMMMTFLDCTSDNPDAINFMLHDFGYRGATSDEAAAIGGAAHLVNFMGTDTLPAMSLLLDFYAADLASLAFSVPATEHSVMTARGEGGEYDVLDQLLANYPTGILSVVADSYNIYEFTAEVIHRKDEILARDGRFVLRPDSVTPEHTTPADLSVELVKLLWHGFGGTVTSKGYALLDDHVRVLWGDGIDFDGIEAILDGLERAGFASDNMVFGMGGGLLQKVNRDTQRFAFKCSAQKRDGQWHTVSKNPLDVSKASKAGRLKLVRSDRLWSTVTQDEPGMDLLVPVYENGVLLMEYTLDEVRANALD